MAKTRRPSWPQAVVKALFGRAANRCSICNCAVTELPETKGDGILVLGEIAHINALSSDGPRGDKSLTKKERSEYANLILLCANCHLRIDHKEISYTVAELKRIKAEHETHNEKAAQRLDSKKAERIIDAYLGEFRSAYQRAATKFVFSGYKIGDNVFPDANQIPDATLKQNVILLGRSGFGKSLLAKHIAIGCLENSEVPFIVEAIQFSKNIDPHFDSEHGIVSSTFNEVEAACAVLGKGILLIVDGYNECPEPLKIKLNLWIVRFSNTFRSRLLITSQNEVSGLNTLKLLPIELLQPSADGKRKIASGVNDKIDIERVSPLLDAISTGLEARLIGEVSQTISPDASRYAVFDMYARERFGDRAETGIAMLATMAEFLYQRITFSLSVRDFGRLLAAKQFNIPSPQFLFDSGLLTRRGDRTFFNHELFFNAFSAEAIVRNANGDPRQIIVALAAPKHREQRTFILGAIDDKNLLDVLLPQINDFDLIASCLGGDCGEYAKSWADRECSALFKKINAEIEALCFEIVCRKDQQDQDHWSVVIAESSIYKWNEQERCVIHALPLSLFKGKHVSDTFDVLAAMDKRLTDEFNRLRPIAIEKKIGIRSQMFDEVYHGWSQTEVSTRMILKNFVNGGWSLDHVQPSDTLLQFCKDLLSSNKVSNGQLLLVIHLTQKFRWSYPAWKSVISGYVPFLLKARWKNAPHRLRMSFLDAAHYSWDIEQDLKDKIIEQLNHLLEESRGDWLMPTFIIDALQALGALEEDELAYEDTVRTELANIFEGEENSIKCSEAYGFHTRTFDHPYHDAYWRVLSELSDTDAKRLYTMALKGAVDKSSFGIPIALYNVAKFEDPSTADAIRPFTEIPDNDDSMPQSATEAFLLAHVALGWIGIKMDSKLDGQNSPTAKTFLAYAEIMYWLNRRDLRAVERNKEMVKAWKVLKDHNLGTSVGTLLNFDEISNESMRHFAKGKDVILSLQKAFPNEVAEICRQALLKVGIQHGYFRRERKNEIISHAIHLLGCHGTSADLVLLKKYISDISLGTTSLRAIERIEARHAD